MMRVTPADPMLLYFANGRIRWKGPARCNTRTNWEFYVVLDGRCGVIFQDGERPALQEKTLWVFAPECSHAWTDDGHRTYERISLHFGSVPYPLDELVRQNGGWLQRSLSEAEIDRLRTLARAIEPHFLHPTLASPLHFQRHLMDLTLLALEGHPLTTQSPGLTDLATFKIERALSWYAEHVARGPSVKEVADAVHISPSHLRRLFWQVRKTAPKAAFQRLRLEKAKELMSRSAVTLEDVARDCGYASASHFCREYKSVHHFTPTHGRKRLVASFSKPLPPGVVPVRNFSARPAERTMGA